MQNTKNPFFIISEYLLISILNFEQIYMQLYTQSFRFWKQTENKSCFNIVFPSMIHFYHAAWVFRKITSQIFNQSTEAVEYTNCISVERGEISPTSVLDMTLNNLMVRLQ